MINLDFISEYAEKNNILYGICKETSFPHIRKILSEKNHLLCGFVEQDIEKRINASLTMEDVKNIIVFAKSYKKRRYFNTDLELRGALSDNAVGLDYHKELYNDILNMMDIISKNSDNDFKYMIFVDTGPLSDRELAKRALLGDIGLSGNIITNIGGMVNLGYCLINKEASGKISEFKNKCNLCEKCINACPAKAIKKDGAFEFERCISYLTQKKGLLSILEMKLIGVSLYGCDICQKVCPKNKTSPVTNIYNIDDILPKITDILSLSNKEFKNKYGNTAIGWRGGTVIKRNALIALGNMKNKNGIKILKEYMKNENEILRVTAEKAYLISMGEA